MVRVLRGFSVVVGVPLRTGLGVSGAQMKRGMGIAVREREEQQHNQAAREQGPHHCNELTPRSQLFNVS
jgi:hypothetical protein